MLASVGHLRATTCALALLAAPVAEADKTEPETERCASAASCARYVACFAGFSRSMFERRWLCERKASASSVPPTCVDRDGASDWRWSARARRCRRQKPGGAVVYSSANIRCPSDHRYDDATGRCRKPGKTIYARTVLSTSTVSKRTPQRCATPKSCASAVSCPDGYSRFTRGNRFYCAAPSKEDGKTRYRPARLQPGPESNQETK